jgi:hypothetical protein
MDVVSLFSILAWPGNIILAKQFLTSDRLSNLLTMSVPDDGYSNLLTMT